VQGHQPLAPCRPFPKVIIERDTRELTLEIDFVFGAVGGMVQHGVDIMENIGFGYVGRIANSPHLVMFLELPRRPVGDVFLPGGDCHVRRDSHLGGIYLLTNSTTGT
jgi:hypothetical protein